MQNIHFSMSVEAKAPNISSYKTA